MAKEGWSLMGGGKGASDVLLSLGGGGGSYMFHKDKRTNPFSGLKKFVLDKFKW